MTKTKSTEKGVRWEREEDGALQVYLDGRPYAWFHETKKPMLQGRVVSEDEYLSEIVAIHGASQVHGSAF